MQLKCAAPPATCANTWERSLTGIFPAIAITALTAGLKCHLNFTLVILLVKAAPMAMGLPIANMIKIEKSS